MSSMRTNLQVLMRLALRRMFSCRMDKTLSSSSGIPQARRDTTHSIKYTTEAPRVSRHRFSPAMNRLCEFEQFLKKVIGAIVVYDATEPETFKRMNQWVVELKQYLPAETPIVIAGNKSDLHNNLKIDDDTAKSYAKSQNTNYYPTSAKTGLNVTEIFNNLAQSKYLAHLLCQESFITN